MSWLLLGAQWSIFGLSSYGYHLVSILLHIANSMLLYVLIRRILHLRGSATTFRDAVPDRIGAIAAVLLFACHPLRVEAVAWISCQPYLPAVACYLLAVLAYLNAFDGRPGRRGLWFVAAFAAYLAAVGFKAVAVSWPIVLLIIDVWVLKRRSPESVANRAGWLRILAEKLPFFLAAAPVCLWAVVAKDFNDSRVPWADINLNECIAQSVYGIVFYLYRSILPIGLSPYCRIPDDLSLTGGVYLISAIVVISVTVVLILSRKRAPWLLAGWLAYIAILLPNLGVVQFSQQLATDRYSYLAIMPIMIVIAAGISRFCGCTFAQARPSTIAICALLTGAHIFGVRSYARHWHDSISLWQRVLALDPQCAVAHCNLGDALLREDRFADASAHFSTAIDLDPNFSFAYSNFAAMLVRAGRMEDAVVAGERALRADPPLKGLDLARAHAIIGEAYAGLRKDDLAWGHTLKAKELGFKEADKMIDYLSRFSKPPQSTVDEPRAKP